MTDLGALQDDDVTPAGREGAAGGQPEQAGSDDRDVAHLCHLRADY
jgi:hypothetical protein